MASTRTRTLVSPLKVRYKIHPAITIYCASGLCLSLSDSTCLSEGFLQKTALITAQMILQGTGPFPCTHTICETKYTITTIQQQHQDDNNISLVSGPIA